MKKKHMKDATNLIGLGAVTSIGANISGTEGAKALGNFSSFYPTMGTLMGANMMMDSLKGLNVKKKKRRY